MDTAPLLHAGKALCQGYRYPHPTSAPSGHLLPEEGGSDHASPFPWKGLPSAARRGWLSLLTAKPPPLCLPHYYESRLSGWAGSLGSEGSEGSTGSTGSTGVEGTHNSYSVPIPHIYNFAALLILMRRTTPFEPFEPIEPVEPMH